MKRNLLALTITIAALGAAAATPARADNVAVAVNTKDGSTEWKMAFHLTRTPQSTVDAGNAAVAFSSCADCTTYAVAFQGVIGWGDPNNITLDNIAFTVNSECDTCQGAAEAYQVGVIGDTKLRFTTDGIHQLNDIRKGLHDLRKQNLTFEQSIAAIEAYGEQFKQIFQTELIAITPAH
jgi:hypothetical protein